MKKTVLVSVLGIGLYAATCMGCKETTEVTMQQIHQLQDSIPKFIPAITAIDVKVEHQSELKVIISNVPFYTGSPEQMYKAATKIGETAMMLFGADNTLKSGKLIITKENRQSAWDKDPADGIVVDMKLDSLREYDELLLHFLVKLPK